MFLIFLNKHYLNENYGILNIHVIASDPDFSGERSNFQILMRLLSRKMGQAVAEFIPSLRSGQALSLPKGSSQ